MTFLRFRNLSETDQSAFFTNTDVISDFKQYIGTLVNRSNTYTNVSLAFCLQGALSFRSH